MNKSEIIKRILNNEQLNISSILFLRDKLRTMNIYDTNVDGIKTVIEYYDDKNLIKSISIGGESIISFKNLINKFKNYRTAFNWRDNYTLISFDNDRIELKIEGNAEIKKDKIIATDPYGNSKSYNIEDFYFNSIKVNL